MLFPNADKHCTILDAPFDTNSADVVIAYGSLQFIDEQFTRENLKKIISWVKIGGLIEMKVNGRYINSKYESPGRFWWNYDAINKFTAEFNLEFEIKPYLIDTQIGPRIFWTWIKL